MFSAANNKLLETRTENYAVCPLPYAPPIIRNSKALKTIKEPRMPLGTKPAAMFFLQIYYPPAIFTVYFLLHVKT